MATEAPLLHHSQCTAGVNMSSTGGLNGFNGSGQFLVVGFTATRSVVIPLNATIQPAGILQNDPISGFVADIGFLGITKVIAGVVTSVVAGAPVMAEASTGGRVIVFGTPATNIAVGYAMETPAAINNVIMMMVAPLVLD